MPCHWWRESLASLGEHRNSTSSSLSRMPSWSHSRVSWVRFTFLVQACCVHHCHGSMYMANDKNLIAVPSDLPNDVTYVEIKRNSITEIENSSLNGLANLEKLYIGYNQLSSIHPEAFCGTALRLIGLNYNNFTTVPELRCLPSFAESVHDFQRDTFVCSWASSED